MAAKKPLVTAGSNVLRGGKNTYGAKTLNRWGVGSVSTCVRVRGVVEHCCLLCRPAATGWRIARTQSLMV